MRGNLWELRKVPRQCRFQVAYKTQTPSPMLFLVLAATSHHSFTPKLDKIDNRRSKVCNHQRLLLSANLQGIFSTYKLHHLSNLFLFDLYFSFSYLSHHQPKRPSWLLPYGGWLFAWGLAKSIHYYRVQNGFHIYVHSLSFSESYSYRQ
jgi:hypothetical protein